MIPIFFILLVVALLLESTIVTLPLLLVTLLLFYIKQRKVHVLTLACVFGVLIDSILVRHIGFSSLFFVAYLFLIMLYERKFEIDTYPFIFLASLGGSILYALFFEAENIVMQSLVASIVALILFFLINRFRPRKFTRTNFEI